MTSAPHKRGAGSAYALRRSIGFVMLVASSCFAFAVPSAAAQETSTEYQVKAAFLLNFAQYIEWPDRSFDSASAPIVVGILGDDPFGSALDEVFQGESIRGRSLAVKRSQSLEDLKDCHMLFISKSQKDRVREIIANLRDKSVVTVGDLDGVARMGGIISFYLDGAKLRFEINAREAQRKDLKISSQLLRRARVVGS